MGWHGVCRSACFAAFAVCLKALMVVLPAMALDLTDKAALKELAADWESVDKSGCLSKTLGALDGLVPKIPRPTCTGARARTHPRARTHMHTHTHRHTPAHMHIALNILNTT